MVNERIEAKYKKYDYLKELFKKIKNPTKRDYKLFTKLFIELNNE